MNVIIAVVESPSLAKNRMWAVLRCFFFQAEDGIRDTSVTGVQTCALPISAKRTWPGKDHSARARPTRLFRFALPADNEARSQCSCRAQAKECQRHAARQKIRRARHHKHNERLDRSEERRVGKE